MNELRKQFEVLPEIEILLNRSNIFFSEDDMNYFTYNYDDQSLVDDHCIKLAWYAFQEQQKKIDMAMNRLNEFSWASDSDVKEIKGLLK